MSILLNKMLGLNLEKDKETMLSTIVNSGYTSTKVVGRGTLVVDSSEVTETEEYKMYVKKARKIIEAKKDNVA